MYHISKMTLRVILSWVFLFPPVKKDMKKRVKKVFWKQDLGYKVQPN